MNKRYNKPVLSFKDWSVNQYNLLQSFFCRHTYLCISVIQGPDYIRQKYNEPVEVKEVPVEEKKEKSPSGSPHFYRKGTTPTQSPSQSPGPSPTPSPAAVKKSFFTSKTPATVAPVLKDNKTPTAESLTAGKQLIIGLLFI